MNLIGWLRGWCLSLTLVFFSTNVLFADVVEKNFWSKRRQTIGKIKNSSDSFDVVRLTGNRPGITPIEILKQATALPKDGSSALSQNLAKSLPSDFIGSHKPLFEALPLSLGTVRGVALPKGRPKHTVLYIQDVHLNLDAQTNIGQAIRSLAERKVADVLALEGAWGPMDFSAFRSFHDPNAVREAADYLLRKNSITGPVRTALSAPVNFPTVVGVDDKNQYHANVNAYTQSADRIKEYSEAIAQSSHALLTQKARVFNKALLAFDRTVENYRSGHIKLGGYAQAISIAMTDPTSFPSVSAFLHALRLEEGLDLKQVETERADLIEKLAKNLTPSQLSGLLEKTMAYRAGQLRYGEFYAHLKDLRSQCGVNLKKLTAMDGYIHYVLASENIDADALLGEMSRMEKIAYSTLAKTPEEKKLVAESNHLFLTGKLVEFSLTTKEWKEYEALTTEGVTNNFDLTSFESFYRHAIARDRSMAENLIRQMEGSSHGPDSDNRISVLVTGGFHSEGITTQLRNAGAAVINFVPKISRVDAIGGESLSIFTQEKTPLEKLFSGQKLFLGINQTEAESHIQQQMALLVALIRKNSSTIPGKVKLKWDTSRQVAKVLEGGRSFIVKLQRAKDGLISGISVSLDSRSTAIDFLWNIGKAVFLGLSLFWIFLVYPDISSSGLVAGFIVGGLSSNGSSSHIKFIGDDEPMDPAHDGEKAYHLGVLARLGVNIPPGFALQPSFYTNDYQHTKSLSNVMADVLKSLKRLEEKTGQVFGNEQNPIFLSVRSNAGEEESMPGLMKTIINVGLNQTTFRGLVERDGEWFAQDALRRFIRSYATGVYDIADEEFYLASTDLLLKYGVGEERLLPAEGLARLVDKYRSIVSEHGREIPEDVNEQLSESLEAVLKSFDTGGAQIYKEVRGLSNAGMGAIVQKVVFGNLDDRSGAGVVFTRNRRTGENSLDGQFGNRIQGEDVVSGFQATGMKDAFLLKAEMPHVYDSLLHIKSLVENKFGWPQDIEFTIQKGEIFILQTRRAALSPEAFLRAGEDMVNEGIIPTNVFITRQAVEMGKIKELFHLRAGIKGEVIMRGTTGTSGAQRGRMMLSDRFDPFHPPEDPVIIVDPNPNAQNLLRILFSPHVAGLITFEGPRTSHARTRCQSSDMPSVMGIEGISRDGNNILLSNGDRILEGVWIVVDGDRRRVLLTKETDVLERSKLIRDASLRIDEVQGIEEQVQRQWRGALYEEVLEEYVVAAQDLERIKEKFPTISRSELDTANVRLHTLHQIAWEKGAEKGISRERVNRDFVAMKQMVLKSFVAEEALRKGEVSIMLLEDSSTDRSGSKCLDPRHAELLFGDTLAKNRERAERMRQEKYPEYPSKERLLREETRHHDGGGVRYFTHLIYVNVPSGRAGDERKQDSDAVVAQNMKYQEIITNLESRSPNITYDEGQRKLKNTYMEKNIELHWWPNTESNNTTSLSLLIKSPTNENLTLSETGSSTTIDFSNEHVGQLPYQCLRSLFKEKDTVYLVVSPELSRFLDKHGIPRVFSHGRGKDLTSVRIVSSTVAPVIKQNIQERAAQDYIEKDLSALQEFKKYFWDPLISTLTPVQVNALVKLIFSYEVRSNFQSMPPFLLLNHNLFRQMVPGMSQDRWEDKLYLDRIIKQLLQAVKLDDREIYSLLGQFHDPSVRSPQLGSVFYSSFLQVFRAFERAGASLPQELKDMLSFLEIRKYSSPWDENGLFRVAAGLLPEEKKPDPPSSKPDDPTPPPQNPDSGPGEVAKTDAIVVANLLREATKDNFKPLLNEVLLPTNQPLQALLGNTPGGAAQQETVFDRIKKFQTDPAYTIPFKEALKSALGDTGILAGTDLGHQQAGVVSLNRENLTSVQAEIQLRGTLNTLFEGLGLRDQGQPLHRTIVVPTSDEAAKLVNKLGAFPGIYVAIPKFGPGETLTVPKLVNACEELIAKGWIVPATALVPLNKMENLDSASLTNTYLTPLENKLKTLAVTAKDLPELKRVTQEIKSFLDLLKTVAEMA